MKLCIRTMAILALFAASVPTARAADLQEAFLHPPEQTKPWCYWYWISDNVSREGITRDVEAMARVGIGEALIGNVFLDDVPAGKIKVLGEEWWGLVEHAIREGGRVGVNIGMFNCPGWSQSGGPWVKPEEAMRYLVSSETRVTGPASFAQKLPKPKEPFQDVALLAFPAPRCDADSLAAHGPRITCTPAVPGAEKLADGRLDAALTLPGVATVDIELAEAMTARSLSLTPGQTAWSANCELQAAASDGRFLTVKSFKFDRSNMAIAVGPMPRGPVTAAFPATTAKHFRLRLTSVQGEAALAELNLSAAARVESFVEKQLGKMHPTPLPMWDTYLWPAPPEPESPQLAVSPGEVHNLSAKLEADGTLRWDVPAGEWVILRTGMTPTGMRNAPASPEGQGLEVDKMNRAAASRHFDAFIGQVLKRMPAADRKAFKRVVADSYEMGSQNWTDGFAATFRERYGYDAAPWLPVLTGRIVGSADLSDRFLWDLRRLVADHVARDYVGGLRDLCRPHGLQLWLENYGHWGFPAEFLQYGAQSDRIGGEFWAVGELGSIECRAASSCANTYGRPIVSAEAFTSAESPFQRAPAALKARGDWAFCEGINHFVLHVNIQQPSEDKMPGVNAWFGTEFNRHNTWFNASGTWIDYLRRCCFLLQQGTRAADVAYFIGEDAPKMTGVRRPELPPGRDFDYINAEVILDKLTVKDGLLALPHGTSYRVLVLPGLATMRPEVLRKVRDLVKAGATVVGLPPARSPSMENYPQCDVQLRALAAEVWGELAVAASGGRTPPGERRLGAGRVIWGKGLGEILAAPADFQSAANLRFTHRVAGDMDIYFVANAQAQELVTTAAFRVNGKAPEFWRPETGRIERAAVYDLSGGVVSLPIHLGPHGSVFVVFREKADAAGRIVSVRRNGEPLLDAQWTAPKEVEPATASQAANNFTLAVWAKPAADTTLVPESNRGVSGLGEPRNDALFPPHGSGFSSDPGHAGCGLAVGRNGVVVFEHGASYFAPVLVHAATVADWTLATVVYRNGQPSLYLNGALARRGLKSQFTVHGGTGAGGGSPFRGDLGPIEHFARSLSDAEVARLTRAMPRPGAPLPSGAIELTRANNGAVEARAWQAGHYQAKTGNGKTLSIEVNSVPAPLELAGPWEVRFVDGRGAPDKITFDKLVDWTQRAEEGIKHYSGRAVYRTTFPWHGPAGNQSPAASILLDLGNVRDLATVRLNGRTLGTLWLAPWQVEIASAVKPGENTLEIEVVNPWNNRLVGDRSLPPGQRSTFLAVDVVPKNGLLLPAGLLGPVKVRAARSVSIRSR